MSGETRDPEVWMDSNDVLDEMEGVRLFRRGESDSPGADAFRGGRGGGGRATTVGPDTNLCRKGLVEGCCRSPYALSFRFDGEDASWVVEEERSFGSDVPWKGLEGNLAGSDCRPDDDLLVKLLPTLSLDLVNPDSLPRSIVTLLGREGTGGGTRDAALRSRGVPLR